jgi:hypothetical protein
MNTEHQRLETKVVFRVEVTVPSRMLAEVEQDLATCISFGRPVITKLCEVPAAQAVMTTV